MAYPIIKSLIKPLFLRRIKEIKGAEYIPDKGPFLLAGNHNSYLDGILLGSIIVSKTNQRIYFLTHYSIWRFFKSFGLDNWLGMIPIEPEKKAESLKEALKYLNQGKIICVFPEGSRVQDKNLGKGKTGAARLSLWSKFPLIPFGIITEPDRNVPRAIRNYFHFKHKITLKFGPPINLEEYYSQSLDKPFLDEVTRKIMLEISKLCHKPYPF